MQQPAPEDFYQVYKKKPTQQNLSAVLKSLQPTIQYALNANNALGDPFVKTMADVYAVEAVKKYDPSQDTNLNTWVGSELRQIGRVARQSRSVLKVPERTQMDAFRLMSATKELEDKLGREPNVGELADHTGYSVKRIEKVRTQTRAVPSQANIGGELEQEGPDFTTEALDYVYNEADHVDRKILEHKVGYGGAELLEPQVVATKLGLTPSQLSRRSARLSLKINEYQNLLETQ